MADVFLLHANADREKVKLVHDALQTHGIDSYWPTPVRDGGSPQRSLDDEASMARCVMVFWSQSSLASDWVRMQSQKAFAAKKAVSVLLEANIQGSLPAEYRNAQMIFVESYDFRNGSHEWNQIEAALLSVVVPSWCRAVPRAQYTAFQNETRIQQQWAHEAKRQIQALQADRDRAEDHNRKLQAEMSALRQDLMKQLSDYPKSHEVSAMRTKTGHQEEFETLRRENSVLRSQIEDLQREYDWEKSPGGLRPEVLAQQYRKQAPTVSNEGKGDTACSVFAPTGMRSRSSALIQVFLHHPDDQRTVDLRATQIDQSRGRSITGNLEIPLEINEKVEIVFDPGGLSAQSEVRQTLVWRGRPVSVNFPVTAPLSVLTRTFLPTIRVLRNDEPIGRIVFRVRTGIFQGNDPGIFTGDSVSYRRAFLSYSSVDRGEVLKRAQALKLAGVEVFQDVLSIKSGQDWSEELRNGIEQADVVFLFWSKSAKSSKAVMKELRHAIRQQAATPLRRPDIIPVILDVPPPLPPTFLRHLHFNDPLSPAISTYSDKSGGRT